MTCDRILSWGPDIHILWEKMLRRSPVIKCFMVFALAFGLRQATVFFLFSTPYENAAGSLASFGITLMTVLFIRFGGSSFRERGFQMRKRAKRLLTVSVFLAFLYVLVVIFVPGGISGFEAVPSAPISWGLLLSAGSIVLAVVAAETVFRGYVQTDLEKAFGSYVSMAVVSLMFTLYMLPITLVFHCWLSRAGASFAVPSW